MDGVGDYSDGHPEAWFLPDADDLPSMYAKVGKHKLLSESL